MGTGKYSLLCLGFPDKKYYYDTFFNEIVINKKIAKSRLAAKNFRISLFLVIGTDFLDIQCICLNPLEKK